VLLCLSSANDIDATGIEMLKQMHLNLTDMGIQLRLSGVKKQVQEVLDRTSLFSELGDGSVFATDREAIRMLSDRAAAPL
jgi:anti-anti-sigma regulatory factor